MAEKDLKSLRFKGSDDVYKMCDETARERLGLLSNAIDGKVTQTDFEALEEKVDGISVPDVSGFATKNELQQAIEGIEIPSVDGLASEEFVNEAIENINIPDVSNFATKTELENAVGDIELPSTEGLATTEYVDNAVKAVNGIDTTNILKKSDVVSYNKLPLTASGGRGEGNSKANITHTTINSYTRKSTLTIPEDDTASSGFVRSQYYTAKAGLNLEVGDKFFVGVMSDKDINFTWAFGSGTTPMNVKHANPDHYGVAELKAGELKLFEFELTERDVTLEPILSDSKGGTNVLPNLNFCILFGNYTQGGFVSTKLDAGEYNYTVFEYAVKKNDLDNKYLDASSIPAMKILPSDVKQVVKEEVEESISSIDCVPRADTARLADGVGYKENITLTAGTNCTKGEKGAYTINGNQMIFKATKDSLIAGDWGGSFVVSKKYSDIKGLKIMYKCECNCDAKLNAFQMNFGANWGASTYWTLPSTCCYKFNNDWYLIDIDKAVEWAKEKHADKVPEDFDGIIAIMAYSNNNWKKYTKESDGKQYVDVEQYGVDEIIIKYTFVTLVEDAMILSQDIVDQANKINSVQLALTSLQGQVESNGGNVLWGKKYVACGDSFTQGDFSGYVDENGLSGHNSPVLHDPVTGYYKTYPYWIAKRNNMTLVNEALCGSIMSLHKAYIAYRDEGTLYNSGTNYVNYTPTVTFCSPFAYDRILKVPADADFLTFWFGINDSGKTNLGTIDDFSGTSAEIAQFVYDDAGHIIKGDNLYTTNSGNVKLGTVIDTFYGAYQYALWYFLKNRPMLHMGIIVTNSCGVTYRNAIIAIAKKWGIPYLDMMGDDSIPNITGKDGVCSAAQQLVKNKFYVTSSNGHPNHLAHEFQSNVIESFLRRI